MSMAVMRGRVFRSRHSREGAREGTDRRPAPPRTSRRERAGRRGRVGSAAPSRRPPPGHRLRRAGRGRRGDSAPGSPGPAPVALARDLLGSVASLADHDTRAACCQLSRPQGREVCVGLPRVQRLRPLAREVACERSQGPTGRGVLPGKGKLGPGPGSRSLDRRSFGRRCPKRRRAGRSRCGGRPLASAGYPRKAITIDPPRAPSQPAYRVRSGHSASGMRSSGHERPQAATIERGTIADST